MLRLSAPGFRRSPSGWAWLMARSRIRPREDARLGALPGRRLALARVLLGAVKAALRFPPPPPDRNKRLLSAMPSLASTPPAASRLQRLMAPIPIDASPGGAEVASTSVVPTIDLEHFFGDHLPRFNLARRLVEGRVGGCQGEVTVRRGPSLLAPTWRGRTSARAFRRARWARRGESERSSSLTTLAWPLQVSPDDRFRRHRAGGRPTSPTTRPASSAASASLYLIGECERLRAAARWARVGFWRCRATSSPTSRASRPSAALLLPPPAGSAAPPATPAKRTLSAAFETAPDHGRRPAEARRRCAAPSWEAALPPPPELARLGALA